MKRYKYETGSDGHLKKIFVNELKFTPELKSLNIPQTCSASAFIEQVKKISTKKIEL